MSVYLGNTEIGQMYLGSTEIAEAYLGSTKAYQKLPYDAQVEYLESSGTQYIDTDIVGNLDTDIEVGFNPSNKGSALGARALSTSGSNSISIYVVSSPDYLRFSSEYYVKSFDYANYYNVRINKSGVTINGIKEADWSPSSFSTSVPIFLMHVNNTSFPKFKGKFYFCKIWDNGVLVRDFIPVRKGNVGYMYDQVSSQLFGNAGSGNFVLGNDITT